MFSALEDKNVLVTGGAGFVGSHLIDALIGAKARVICFDDLSTGSVKNIKHHGKNNNLIFIKGDANNKKELKKAFAFFPIDYVFHYAATVGVLRTIEEPLSVLEDIQGIKSILELSKEYGVKKLIYSSSSEVYGEPVEIPEREDGYHNPKLPYATVKLIGEQYLKTYNDVYGLPTTSLRFFNTYGPRQDSSAYGFVVGTFIKQALEGKPITIFGDGTQTRDFVYIEDNIFASLRALLTDETNGHAINLGTGRPVTILDLAEKVIKLVGNQKSSISFLPLRPGGEIKHRFPDVTKMKKLIKHKPKYSLESGLRETLNWHNTVKNHDGKIS